MSKATIPYWNALMPAEQHRWRWIEGLGSQVQELILSHDPSSGEITRLTRFPPGADTAPFGAKAHAFPEEIFIVSGRLHVAASTPPPPRRRLHDAAVGIWLEAGHDASRPPGKVHGPFRTDEGAWCWICPFRSATRKRTIFLSQNLPIRRAHTLRATAFPQMHRDPCPLRQDAGGPSGD